MSAAFSSMVARVCVDVAQNPAFALGYGLFAELLRGDLVAPLAKCALSEFLNVAFVHQRDGLAAGFERVPDGVADQPLGAEDGDGLDAHTRSARTFFLPPSACRRSKADQLGGFLACPP